MFSGRYAAWIMWFFGSVFYAYQYILRVMPNIMMEDIMTKYQINATVFGQFSGFYYIGYALVHIPVGILLDRYGPKKTMPVFMVLTVIGMAPLAFSDFWLYPIIGRALVGIGSSSAILGVFKIIRMSFAEEKFAWMLSLSVTIGLSGTIYGGAPVQYLHEHFGFEKVIMFGMIMGIALSILTYFVLPKYEASDSEQSIVREVWTVFGNTKVIGICILAGLMVGPLEGFADVWGTTFLKNVYGIDATVAAGLPSMMYIGMMFGGPFLSFIAEKTQSYLGVVFACALMMAIAFVALLTTSMSTAVLSVLFFVVGMLCAYQILAIAYAATCVPKQVAGLTSAVANMIIMLFGYFFHTVIGKVIDAFSMTAQGFVFGISVIPIALMIAAIGFGVMMARKTY
ncbi:MAG: MFS transporter [Myxococcota bacterium]